MARGGINKVLVSNARETLISRGESPSIDAIRVELSNTGSKSTIHLGDSSELSQRLSSIELFNIKIDTDLNQPLLVNHRPA